jgi:putative transposase
MTSNNKKNINLDKFCHSVGQNWYHIVLVTHKRRRIFQWKITNAIANEAIEIVCNKHKVSIFTKEVMSEHVHLFVTCPSNYSIRRLIQVIKGGSSYHIRKNFPSLKKYDRIWSKGCMYRSLGSVSAEIVRKYIDNSNIWKPSD